MLPGNWKGSSWSHFAFHIVWPIAVCTCVQLPFNKHTSCLYNRYWSICILHVQVELCPSWSSCINCYCISNGKMWKDSTQIFLSYLSCAEATWYHTKMLTINCPSTWASLSGLWLWSFFRFYFIELFKLSCDHMSLFRLNHVVCRSILLCFFYWIPQDLLKYIKYLH